MPQQIPAIGEDVSALMGGDSAEPAIGDDVSALMEPMPSHGEAQGPPEHPHARTARLFIENLPAIGAGVAALGSGGALAPAVALAGLGGAAGQGLKRIAQGEPEKGSLGEMAFEGAKQGAMELGGGAVAKGLAKGGERLYYGLLKPKDATIQKFPTVVQDLLRDRRLITQGSRAKVVQGMQKIGAEKGRVLEAADATGKTIPRETLRSGLDDVLQESMRTSETPVKDLGKLAKIERELLPDEAAVLPSRADALKSKLQAESDRAYRQMKMGTRVTDLPARARTAVASRAKSAVEDIAPGVGELNSKYANLKGQSQALRDALKREGNTSVIGVRDLIGAVGGHSIGGPIGGLAGTALMRLLAQPRAGSTTAITMNELSRVPYGQLLRALMSSHGPDEP